MGTRDWQFTVGRNWQSLLENSAEAGRRVSYDGSTPAGSRPWPVIEKALYLPEEILYSIKALADQPDRHPRNSIKGDRINVTTPIKYLHRATEIFHRFFAKTICSHFVISAEIWTLPAIVKFLQICKNTNLFVHEIFSPRYGHILKMIRIKEIQFFLKLSYTRKWDRPSASKEIDSNIHLKRHTTHTYTHTHIYTFPPFSIVIVYQLKQSVASWKHFALTLSNTNPSQHPPTPSDRRN